MIDAAESYARAEAMQLNQHALPGAFRLFHDALNASIRKPALERRTIRRADDAPTFHPDQIAEAAKVLEFYGGDPGPLGEDVIRRVLCAAAAWQERLDAENRVRDNEIARRQVEMKVGTWALRLLEEEKAR
jgi:hypothetical protein